MNGQQVRHCPQCGQVDWPAMLRDALAPPEPSRPFALSVPIDRAAELVGVSESVMRRWVDRGIVPSCQMEPGGRRLIRVADLDEALRRHATGGETWQESSAGPDPFGERQTKGRQVKAR